MRPVNLLKPILASLIFLALAIYFTYYFNGTLAYFNQTSHPEFALFISSPFNISTDGSSLYSLYLPAALILIIGIYLKNFNKAFQRKCSLRAIFIMAILASYIKSVGSIIYYAGYANYGISLGTSVITLSFIAAFIISLEVYIERKERYEHLYSRFMFSVISILLIALAVLTVLSFFTTSSVVVHLMGLAAFLVLFVPFYERDNIYKVARKEEALLGAEIGRKRRPARHPV